MMISLSFIILGIFYFTYEYRFKRLLVRMRRPLTRISQRGRCIGALDLRKSCCTNGLSEDQGESRCRQSVTRICLALHLLKDAR
jgi:hypothetical protein